MFSLKRLDLLLDEAASVKLFTNLRLGESSITIYSKTVHEPSAYGNIFERNERIAEVHMDSKSVEDTRRLIRKFKENIPSLKKSGMVGLAGDTSNSYLVALLKRNGAKETKLPIMNRAGEKAGYLLDVIISKSPKKYLFKPVKRLVLRFEV